MSFNYARTANTASRLLANFGADATVIKQTAGDYAPETGQASITSTNYTAKAVLLNYTEKETGELLSAGTLIEKTDKKIILERFDAVPDVDDLITFNSVTYRIVNVKTLSPSGYIVIHECRVRT